ncbi:MAG: hypothetical protein KAV25_00595 [Methanophagales archaeon]|nr:hypothetical protein [Methanophagales archaeon]
MQDKNKRILKIGYSFVVMFILLTVTPVVAQEVDVRVSAPEYVEEGEAFDVTIDVDSITDFNAGQFDLSFDSSVVKVTDVEDGCLDGETIPIVMWAFRDKNTLSVLFGLPGLEGISGSGYLAKISFKAKGEEGDISVLEISNGQLINNKTEEIPANWIGTKIKIREGEGEEGEEEKEEEEEEKTLTPTPRPLSDSLAISLEPGEYKLEFSAHPGDLVSKDLILTNGRDSPAYNTSHTPVAGNASDMIRIKTKIIEEISPGDEEKLTITVSVPEDQELGKYTAYSYFLFSSTGFPPPIPFKIDFSVSVLPEEVKEAYGIDLKIDGKDEVMVKNVTSNETASFKITVKNTGMYFDVMQIEKPEFEDSEGWNVKLYDDAKEVTAFPHVILINAGKEHYLMLNVTGTTPGTNLTVEITGRSSANVTKMDSVRAITYIKPKEEVANVPKVEP